MYDRVYTSTSLEFQSLGRREVIVKFDAPANTSDAGGLLLRELDERFGGAHQMAGCFDDHRSPLFTIHPLRDLLAQRVFGLTLGYEDVSDYEQLRHNPLMALLAGRSISTLVDGFTLAGKSTLNRWELTPVRTSADSRY